MHTTANLTRCGMIRGLSTKINRGKLLSAAPRGLHKFAAPLSHEWRQLDVVVWGGLARIRDSSTYSMSTILSAQLDLEDTTVCSSPEQHSEITDPTSNEEDQRRNFCAKPLRWSASYGDLIDALDTDRFHSALKAKDAEIAALKRSLAAAEAFLERELADLKRSLMDVRAKDHQIARLVTANEALSSRLFETTDQLLAANAREVAMLRTFHQVSPGEEFVPRRIALARSAEL